MKPYPALIDGEKGAYGVTFPDLPGIVATGSTIEEALAHAEEALRDCAIEARRDGSVLRPPTAMENVEAPHGHTLVSVPLIALTGRSVRANLSLDEGVAEFIDTEARRRKMTRTAYVEWMARRIQQMGGEGCPSMQAELVPGSRWVDPVFRSHT